MSNATFTARINRILAALDNIAGLEFEIPALPREIKNGYEGWYASSFLKAVDKYAVLVERAFDKAIATEQDEAICEYLHEQFSDICGLLLEMENEAKKAKFRYELNLHPTIDYTWMNY